MNFGKYFLSVFLLLSFSFLIGPSLASGENGDLGLNVKIDSREQLLKKIRSDQTYKFSNGSLSSPLKNGSLEKGSNYVPNEVLVKFKEGSVDLKTQFGSDGSRSLAKAAGLSVENVFKKGNISVLKSKKTETTGSLISKLKTNPEVEYVQPNFTYHLDSIATNDTHRGLLWALENTGQVIDGVTGTNDADIDAPEAWAVNEGTNTSTIVAIIDIGVAYNHPDLIANMWDGTNCKDENNASLGGCNHGYDFENNDKTPMPDEDFYSILDSHGTHIAGTIAAVKNNAKGVIGVAPNVKIMALKMSASITTAEVVRAISFAKYNGAKIISASWGSNTAFSDQALYEAIRDFPGLFIASAGNNSHNHDSGSSGDRYYPSDFSVTSSLGVGLNNVIGVAATDQNDGLASFSDYGSSSIAVGAPGVNIYSSVAVLADALDEGFESTTLPNLPAGWTVGGTNNHWNTAYSDWWEENVLSPDPNQPYSNNASTSVTSPTIDLSGTAGATLNFYRYCNTEYSDPETTSSDYMALDISHDGGSTFTELDKWNEWTQDNEADPDEAIYPSYYLSESDLTNSVKIRFRWVTNATDSNYEGCWIDYLNLSKVSDGSDETYNYMDGTSMATPHTAGLAGLVWGYNPSLTPAQVKNTVINTGDALSSLNNKTITGKRINAYNALNAFNPAIGYNIDNAIPSSSISQATNGTGIVTVNFKIKDGLAGLAETLSDFGYSIDGGSAWKTPTSGDASTAFSSSWKSNSYLSASNYSSSSYSFTFNSQSGDFADFNGVQQSNVKIRFKANDGAKTSSYTVSEAFAIDNLLPGAPTINDPATTTYASADTYRVTGSAEAGAIIFISRVGGSLLATTTPTSTAYGINVPLEQNTTNTFRILQKDSFGNESPSVDSANVIEDSAPASLSLSSVAGDSSSPYYTTDTTPQIIFNATDALPSLACRWGATDTDYSAMPALNNFSANGSTSLVLSDQGADGVKTIYISCRDLAGNENSSSSNLNISFTLDQTKPIVASASASPNPAKAGTTTITVNFTDVGGMDHSVDPVVSVLGLYSTYASTTKVSFTSSTYVGTISLRSDSEEVSAATIKVIGAKDLAGNTMTDNNNAGSFAVDTIAPAAVVLSGTPSSSTTVTSVDITVSGTGVNFYKYKLDSGSYSSSAATSSHLVLSALNVGSHTLSVIGGDSAGNWQDSASSTDHSWTITADAVVSTGGGGGGGGGVSDTTAPAISNVIATPTAGNTATVTWSTNESSLSWMLYGTTTAYGQQVKTTSYTSSHSVNLTGLTPTTTYHYLVKSQDPSNNVGVSIDKIFTTLAAGVTSSIPTTTTSTTTTTTTNPTIQKSISQMTRAELIALILQLIAGMGKGTTAPQLTGLSAIPSAFTFRINLMIGMNSLDVKYLQIVLNSDPSTRIAVKGFGSPGYETIYFGNSTLVAVKKFQLKYRSELMDPFKLKYPVGMVGDTTRSKLNRLLGR